MKKLGVASLVVVTVLAVAVGAFYLYADSEYTVCYGIFKSREAADRAAAAGRDEDLNADVTGSDAGFAVEFETGETGEDAREARQAFRAVLRRERGTSGHGDTGCLERKPFH